MLLTTNHLPKKHYPIIVVGAGLGGMSVAQILAKLGKKVLLIESHNKLGGLATWFKRSPPVALTDSNQYVFDVSLHGFPYGMVKSFRRYWGQKIADQIIPLRDMRFINPQFQLQTTYTREDFSKILCQHFKVPSERITKFFELVMSITPENDLGITAGELLNNFFPGRPDIIRFLMEPITYANGHTLEDPAVSYSIVFANFMRQGIYTVQGGTDLLLSLMKEELLASDVDIKLHTKINKIVIGDDNSDSSNGYKQVKGVMVNGQLITADVVISNANLHSTIFSLVGEDKFYNQDFIKHARKVRQNTSSCQVYLGIKQGECLPNLGDLVFYSEAPEFDTNLLLRSDKISSRTFSIYYPRLRPNLGRYTIVASSNARYHDWNGLSTLEYQQAKDRLVEDTIACLERLYPQLNIRDKIDYKEAATPLTIERFTGHPQGTSFGTKYEGLSISRKLCREIKGLYHCGSVGIIMSGWLGAVNYGAIVANEVDSYLHQKQANN